MHAAVGDFFPTWNAITGAIFRLAGKASRDRREINDLTKIFFIGAGGFMQPLEQSFSGGKSERPPQAAFMNARRLTDQHDRRFQGRSMHSFAANIRTGSARPQAAVHLKKSSFN
jgi:hypothetical protein